MFFILKKKDVHVNKAVSIVGIWFPCSLQKPLSSVYEHKTNSSLRIKVLFYIFIRFYSQKADKLSRLHFPDFNMPLNC